MVRLLELVACALLVFDLSGAAMLTADEGCRPGVADTAHDSCSPSCLRCSCCVQPLDAPLPVPTGAVVLVGATPVVTAIPLGAPIPSEILHVPRAL